MNLNSELAAHILDTILCKYDEGDTDFSELHNKAFNEDYYIIGYYEASQWLKKHDIDAFDAISFVQEYEQDNFCGMQTMINSESIVNMYAYIKGEDLLFDIGVNLENCTREQLLIALNGV